MKILQAAPSELQATILPLMPMATAVLLYMTYVPVLAAAPCYSPLGISAVRKAAASQGSKAGPQVQANLAASFPPDDSTLLAHAVAFMTQHGFDAKSGSPLDYVVPRKGLWATNSPVAASLQSQLAQAQRRPPPADCLRGKTLAEIDARLGITKKMGGVAPPPPAPVKRIVAPLPPHRPAPVPIVRRPPPPPPKKLPLPVKIAIGGGSLLAGALAFGLFRRPPSTSEKF